jgi:hypothetical protein
MRRIRFEFDGQTLEADMLESQTAAAVAKKLPYEARVMTWGDEVYFDVPVETPREAEAREVMQPGDIAYWLGGPCIAIGFGRTPVSRGDEIRLASPANVFAKATSDVKALKSVRAGSRVRVSLVE